MHVTSQARNAAKSLAAAMDDLPRSALKALWQIPSPAVISLYEHYQADTYGELRDLRSLLDSSFRRTDYLHAYAQHHALIKEVLAIHNEENDTTAYGLLSQLRSHGFEPKLAFGKTTSSRYAGLLEVLRGWESGPRYLILGISNLESVHALRMAYNEPDLIPRIIDVLNANSDDSTVTLKPEVFVMTVKTTGALQDGVL